MSEPKSPYTQCKIKGCDGGPNNKGCFARGFCDRHYSQYRTGRLTLDGRPIRRSRKDTKERARFNQILDRACTVSGKSDSLVSAIEQQEIEENPLFQTETSRKLKEHLTGARDHTTYVRSREFVVNNIEHIGNGTLKKILLQVPMTTDSVTDIDHAKIAKMYKEGKSYDVILIKFGHKYTENQLKMLINGFRKEGLL